MTEDTILSKVISEVKYGKISFCKFLAINDTRRKNSHQCGIYIPNRSFEELFNVKLEQGSNLKISPVRISWQDNAFQTDCVFTYYGKAKDECRITNFGRSFPLLREDSVGDLFILVKNDDMEFSAWLLSTEDDIEEFLSVYGLGPTTVNSIIQHSDCTDSRLMDELQKYTASVSDEFPSVKDMSDTARCIYEKIYDHSENITMKPDAKLLSWIDTEYALFSQIENNLHGTQVSRGFSSMDDFLETAKSIMNRRKSRAGKALENHLEALFRGNELAFETQIITEEKKRPDFIFPSAAAYHSVAFPSSKLIMLAAKTTCKDRWRQILNEADRIDKKYLCTLQQGISSDQLHEMETNKVVLVVPKSYITAYPPEYRDKIMDIKTFIAYVKEKQN